jgi:primosomal protein N''
MQQIRITRTADLNSVLSFLKERYPLLSEAEIIKMALSNQYYQETEGGGKLQNPRERFTKEEWEKGFALMDKMRANTKKFQPQEVEQAIEQAVDAVRQKNRG